MYKKELIEQLKENFENMTYIKLTVNPTEELETALHKSQTTDPDVLLSLFKKYWLPSKMFAHGTTAVRVSDPDELGLVEIVINKRNFILEHLNYYYKDYKVSKEVLRSGISKEDAVDRVVLSEIDMKSEFRTRLISNLLNVIHVIETELSTEVDDYDVTIPRLNRTK